MTVKEGGRLLPERHYFGTDGVRGVANEDLTPEVALRLGRGLVRWLKSGGEAAPVVAIGRDSRLSGDLIEAALTAGMLAEGARLRRLGVVPTAAVAFTTRTLGLAAGAMISASHNPIADNGVKFFSNSGVKLQDSEEAAIEAAMGEGGGKPPTGEGVGRMAEAIGAGPYLAHLKALPLRPFSGRLLVDAAFGSAAAVLPEALAGSAAQIEIQNGQTDGARINVASGSTHPEALQAEIRRRGGSWIGLALDGDADRLIAVDEAGEVVDGDAMMALLVPYFIKRGWMDRRRVALSVLSNGALAAYLAKDDVEVATTPVGDRYLIDTMLREALVLGAEPSGHVVALPFNTTGDGLLTARLLLGALAETGESLAQARGSFKPFPQLQASVHVPAGLRDAVAKSAGVQGRLRFWEGQMGGQGRLLIRPSGTEGLVRVMVEAPDLAFCREVLDDLLGVVESAKEEVMSKEISR